MSYIILHKLRFQKEVFWRVACNSQFREDHNIGISIFCHINKFKNLFCIAEKIADSGIYLRHCNSYASHRLKTIKIIHNLQAASCKTTPETVSLCKIVFHCRLCYKYGIREGEMLNKSVPVIFRGEKL